MFNTDTLGLRQIKLIELNYAETVYDRCTILPVCVCVWFLCGLHGGVSDLVATRGQARLFVLAAVVCAWPCVSA